MNLPKREDWLNGKMIGFVMEAKKLDREDAIAYGRPIDKKDGNVELFP